MAQTEQTTLYFDIDSEAEAVGYIDLAAALTAANRKQYHQVSGGGDPLCYRIRVTAVKGETTIHAASKAFHIGNAVKMTTKGWKAQLRHAGVKIKDLPPYGRRPRFALEKQALSANTTGISGETLYENSIIHLLPRLASGGNAAFSTYTSTDGKTVTYRYASSPGVDKICANQITQVTVTDGSGTESNQPLVLLGSQTTEFNVVREYLKARRQTPDVSIDTPGPAQDSAMLNLFSVAEEMSDDIIDAVDDYMDWKPYTPDNETNTYDDLWQVAKVKSTTTGDYPHTSDVCDIPLGLLKVETSDGNAIRVDVEAIYEM